MDYNNEAKNISRERENDVWDENKKLKKENKQLRRLNDGYYGRTYELQTINDKLLAWQHQQDRKEWKAFAVGMMSGIGWILLFLLLFSPEVISKVF